MANEGITFPQAS